MNMLLTHALNIDMRSITVVGCIDPRHACAEGLYLRAFINFLCKNYIWKWGDMIC